MSRPSSPSRREFLLTSAATAAGFSLANAAPALRLPTGMGKAKACIFMNLVGGPSHLDTFDPKPDAPTDYRGPFRPIPTRVPGLYLSELFPKLAGMADKFSLIRSMHHTAPAIHEAGFQLLNTGHLFREGIEWPSIGSVISYLQNPKEDLDKYTVVTPFDRVSTGINVSHGVEAGWLAHEPAVWSYDSPLAPADFCTDVVRHIASGVPFVLVRQFETVFDSPSWDCHADGGSLACNLDDYRTTVAPSFDFAFSQLLSELEESGLLETTLVVASGEFGRTPKLNANGGRDHWANCWTALVAGGGVEGGRVIGASDRLGTEPVDRPVTPQELVATVFGAFGVSRGATIPGPAREPVAVYPAGPVAELF